MLARVAPGRGHDAEFRKKLEVAAAHVADKDARRGLLEAWVQPMPPDQGMWSSSLRT
jgi:hypothetical protein